MKRSAAQPKTLALDKPIMFPHIPYQQPQARDRQPLSRQDEWFQEIVGDIHKLQFELHKDPTHEGLRKFVDVMMSDNLDKKVYFGKEMAQQYFVKKILLDYLSQIFELPILKLAFQHNDSEILVWAELNDDDWDTEKRLIMAEAKIKAKYAEFGYSMTTIYVEQSDNAPVPTHYLPVEIKLK